MPLATSLRGAVGAAVGVMTGIALSIAVGMVAVTSHLERLSARASSSVTSLRHTAAAQEALLAHARARDPEMRSQARKERRRPSPSRWPARASKSNRPTTRCRRSPA